MRFHKSAAQLAVLALTLVTPMLSHADPKAKVADGMANLVVESTNRGSETVLIIRNVGGTASGDFHARFTFSTGAVYEASLGSLLPGGEVDVTQAERAVLRAFDQGDTTNGVDDGHLVREVVQRIAAIDPVVVDQGVGFFPVRRQPLGGDVERG